MEANRFITKKGHFNRELLSNHEGISRSVMLGDSPEKIGAMSITAKFDKYPGYKEDWTKDTKVILRTLAMSGNTRGWDDSDDKVVNSTLVLSLEGLNNIIANLIDVRDEFVALDNEVCEAFDILGNDPDEDED